MSGWRWRRARRKRMRVFDAWQERRRTERLWMEFWRLMHEAMPKDQVEDQAAVAADRSA